MIKMFDNNQFREFIVRPALYHIDLYSESAEELLIFTCATESLGGSYLKQINGTALGIYQMEPSTYYDLWVNYIINKPRYSNLLTINFKCYSIPEIERITYDLLYATAMTRLYYLRFKEPLPDKNDIDAIWSYYKKYYNTNLGKANKAQSIYHYKKFIDYTESQTVSQTFSKTS